MNKLKIEGVVSGYTLSCVSEIKWFPEQFEDTTYNPRARAA